MRIWHIFLYISACVDMSLIYSMIFQCCRNMKLFKRIVHVTELLVKKSVTRRPLLGLLSQCSVKRSSLAALLRFWHPLMWPAGGQSLIGLWLLADGCGSDQAKIDIMVPMVDARVWCPIICFDIHGWYLFWNSLYSVGYWRVWPTRVPLCFSLFIQICY